jgi:hypothetical protein
MRGEFLRGLAPTYDDGDVRVAIEDASIRKARFVVRVHVLNVHVLKRACFNDKSGTVFSFECAPTPCVNLAEITLQRFE